MNIKSAEFVKGIIGTDDALENDIPQIAFIGRSNVGKSSVINSLTKKKGLAIISNTPGRTQQINLYYINRLFYLLDMPGYGYAKVPKKLKEKIVKLIEWYFFKSDYTQKVIVVIIDAKVGPTEDDLNMLDSLSDHNKNVVIVANKIDKIKSSLYEGRISELKNQFSEYLLIPYSATKEIGVGELIGVITKR